MKLYIIQNSDNNFYMQDGYLFNTMNPMKAHRYERLTYAQQVRKNLKLTGIRTRLIEIEVEVTSSKVLENE